MRKVMTILAVAALSASTAFAEAPQQLAPSTGERTDALVTDTC